MAVDYERPVGPWVAAVGTYVLVAGLVALLGYTAKRAIDARGGPPPEEHPELARELAREKEENAGRSPAAPGGLADALRSHVRDTRVLFCPTVEEKMRQPWWPARAAPEEDASYCYVAGLSQRESPNRVLLFDEEWNHEGGGANVLYLGGHVRWVPDALEPAREVERAARDPGGRGGGRIARPWWSRAPDRPAIIPPPAEEPRDAVPTAYVAIAAGAFAAGAVLLGRYARRSA